MKPGDRWKEVKYAYTHNRIPEPQPRTTFDEILAALKLTEAEALQIAWTPKPTRGAGQDEAAARERRQARRQRAKLRRALYARGVYRTVFVPVPLLTAFGWEREVEDYVNEGRGGRLRNAPKKGSKS